MAAVVPARAGGWSRYRTLWGRLMLSSTELAASHIFCLGVKMIFGFFSTPFTVTSASISIIREEMVKRRLQLQRVAHHVVRARCAWWPCRSSAFATTTFPTLRKAIKCFYKSICIDSGIHATEWNPQSWYRYKYPERPLWWKWSAAAGLPFPVLQNSYKTHVPERGASDACINMWVRDKKSWEKVGNLADILYIYSWESKYYKTNKRWLPRTKL